jgi:hypothetical protein
MRSEYSDRAITATTPEIDHANAHIQRSFDCSKSVPGGNSPSSLSLPSPRAIGGKKMGYGEFSDVGVDVAYVLVTYRCPVGCPFCDVDANSSRDRQSLGSTGVNRVARFLANTGLKTLVLSGGEPLYAPSETFALLEAIPAETVEVITSAYWASTVTRAAETLRHLARMVDLEESALRLRVSIDKWHVRSDAVSFQHYTSLLRAVSTADLPNTSLYFRSIIQDETVSELAQFLGGSLVDVDPPYLRRLKLDHANIDVQFKPLRFIPGNDSWAKDSDRRNSFPVVDYVERLEDGEGRFRPGLTYDYLKTERLKGLNLEIRPDGGVKIYGGTPPDNIVNVHTHSFSAAKKQWLNDILVRALLEDGPDHLIDLASEAEPGIREQCLATNDYSLFPDIALATPRLRFYTTVRVVQGYVEQGNIRIRDLRPGTRELVSMPRNKLLQLY